MMSERHDGETARRRVVVVGSDGRLGRLLVEVLRQRHSVVGLGRVELDLGSAESVEQALAGLDYDCLFLTGALTAVDYCEIHEEEAFAINAEGPRLIAEISARKGAHVTYISTDMVFDGTKSGPYLETDKPIPLSVYGASKLEGEQRVLSASAANLVVRVSWVFGPGRPAFPEWIIGQACAKEDLTLPGDKTACPTYTLDLIGWLEALVFGRAERPASGIYHLCNSEPCSWRDWGQFCIESARKAGLPVIAREISPVPVDSVAAFVAKRPLNSALDTTKFQQLTGIRPRSWREAIRDHVMQNIPRPE
jgi:dTDP-4-dehydrorhamnose reductase